MEIGQLKTTVNVNKKIGVALWIGDYEPEFIIKCILLNNVKKFDKFYLISNIPDLTFPTKDKVNIIYLSSSNLIEWVRTKYKFSKSLAGNYYADILCYNAAMILREAYGLDVDKAFKVDLDYWIYNDWSLNQIFDRDFMMFTDYSTYISNLGEKYWNAAISLTSNYNKYIDMINRSIMKLLDGYKNDIESIPYTMLGPKLSNSYKNEFDWLFRNIHVDTISIHPGILTKGINFIKYKEDCLGVHLMISQLKKMNLYINCIEECNGGLNLVI